MALILIVDDSPTELQRPCRRRWRSMALRPRPAAGRRRGACAWRAEMSPDLIFHGHRHARHETVTRPTRAHWRTIRARRTIPIIMVTSKGQETDRIWGAAPGSGRLHDQARYRPIRLVAKAQATLSG